MDNLDPATPGNPDPVAPAAPAFTWKSSLSADYANSPTMQKFPDTKEGFNEAVKSHLSLERLLGHEKVPIPKGKDDVEARLIFNKAMGIPDKPELYGLPDVEVPAALKGMSFDKAKFAETIHKHGLTIDQAKGVYADYVEMTKSIYGKALQDHQTKLTGVINQLRSEWGDAYQSKVELGQMVINKFSDDKDMNDFITATLTQDPKGIKFLARLGDQFTENKIGDFKYARHSLTPDEAKAEVDAIRANPNHPYNNERAPFAEREKAIDYVNGLIKASIRDQG